MSFKGMNSEEGRTVADTLKTAGTNIQEAFATATTSVNSANWVGDDRESYVADWSSLVTNQIDPLVDALTTKSEDLRQQAEEQDTTSTGGGSSYA